MDRWMALTSDRRAIGVTIAIVSIALLTFPLYGSDYQITAIVALSMILGIIALGLVFLAGYGGMISLGQMGIAGISAYTIGILTVGHSSPGLGIPKILGIGPFLVVQPYSWWVGVLAALAISTFAAFLFGIIAVRSQGIYFLMITLAFGMIVYNFALENYDIFNGHGGIPNERGPSIGSLNLDPTKHARPFYYLCLAVAVLTYAGLRYIIRSPFGLALQAVRDNPRRMRALGYWVEAHRVAAFTLAGFISGIGGILYVWYYQTISPDAIDLTRAINVLVIAVIGGMIYFEGAFLGALVFTVVTNFASSYTDRFNSVIGLTFLLIVLFSPNGLIGLPQVIIGLPRAFKRIRDGRLGAGLLRASSVHFQESPRQIGPPGSLGPPVESSMEGVDETGGK